MRDHLEPMPLTDHQRRERRALIMRRNERKLKRLATDTKLPDEVADETVEVVTPDAEMEALPDSD